MSICTKTGDAGMTGLMYNRRVSKTDPRIEACGAVDELNAALGLARAATREPLIASKILIIQKELINLMGELATHSDDLQRYVKDGFKLIDPNAPDALEDWIKDLETQKISFKGWATPGATAEAAALDFARTVSRRAERRVQELLESGEVENRNLQIYLNRISDLLWLFARWAETIDDSSRAKSLEN
ncbi:MAG TPA: cob(I)yrinic acid a,c-diamide adenosyltransferase [Verrucomicrobiae bacterium]|nr:cob(I)yrinic acid a,c-diamide adenosyltransferase [Verrucomicrobiae bacterium]